MMKSTAYNAFTALGVNVLKQKFTMDGESIILGYPSEAMSNMLVLCHVSKDGDILNTRSWMYTETTWKKARMSAVKTFNLWRVYLMEQRSIEEYEMVML